MKRALTFADSPEGALQLRVLAVTPNKPSRPGSPLQEYRVLRCHAQLTSEPGYKTRLAINGPWTHLPSHKPGALQLLITAEERLRTGSLNIYTFSATLPLICSAELPLMHNQVSRLKLQLDEGVEGSQLEGFTAEVEVAFISALSEECSGVRLDDDSQYLEAHPFILEINEISLNGLGAFFETNLINPGRDADYFLAIGDDLTDPSCSGQTVREIKLTSQMIAGAVTPTALLPEGVVQFYAARDLTPGSVFNVAVLEKPKLKYVERSAKTFLSAMQQIASGGAFSVEAYLDKFSGKKLEECLEDDEQFYYDEDNISVVLYARLNTREHLPHLQTNFPPPSALHPPCFAFEGHPSISVTLAARAYSSQFLDFPFGRLYLEFKSSEPLLAEGEVRRPVVVVQSAGMFASGAYLGLTEGGGRRVEWVSEDTGKPKIISCDVLGAAQRMQFLLFSKQVAAAQFLGYADLSVSEIIRQTRGQAHIAMKSKSGALLGYLRIAYKFEQFYPQLLSEFESWREVGLKPPQEIWKTGLRPLCRNEFTAELPLGVLEVGVSKLRHSGDFMAKIRHDPAQPLWLALRMNGDAKYIDIPGFSAAEHETVAVSLRTQSYEDRLGVQLVTLKDFSTAEVPPIRMLRGMQSALKIVKHEEVAVATLLSLTADGRHNVALSVEDHSVTLDFPLLATLELELQLRYEPGLVAEDLRLPVGSVANTPFAVIGHYSHVRAKEPGYLGNKYQFTYAPGAGASFNDTASATLREEPTRAAAVPFVAHFKQHQAFLAIEAVEMRQGEQPVVFRQDVNLAATSNTMGMDGQVGLALWTPFTLKFDAGGEQLAVERLKDTLKTPSSNRMLTTGAKFSESLLAFKRTGKLPKSPYKTPRSDKSVFNQHSSQRSPTIRRIATGRPQQAGALQFISKLSCVTSDFIHSGGRGSLLIFFEQVSLLRLYHAQVLNEQSFCRVRLISADERALDTRYRVSVLDLDSSAPLVLPCFLPTDTLELVLETQRGEQIEEFKMQQRLVLLPIGKERFEFYTLLGNENLQLGFEFEIALPEPLLTSAEELVLSQRSKAPTKLSETFGQPEGPPPPAVSKPVPLSGADLRTAVAQLKKEVNVMEQRQNQKKTQLRRAENELDVTKRKLKELGAVQPEDPGRALSLQSFLTDIRRMKNMVGSGRGGGAKENEPVNPQEQRKLKEEFIKTYEAFQPLAEEFAKYSEDQRGVVLEKKALMLRKAQKMKEELRTEARRKINIQDHLASGAGGAGGDTATLRREVVRLQNALQFEEREAQGRAQDLRIKNEFVSKELRQKILANSKLEAEIKALRVGISASEGRLAGEARRVKEKKSIIEAVHAE